MTAGMKYELRWGNSRGDSMVLEIPGSLEVEMVVEMARGVRLWYGKRRAGIKEEIFVTVDKVEEQMVVTPVEL